MRKRDIYRVLERIEREEAEAEASMPDDLRGWQQAAEAEDWGPDEMLCMHPGCNRIATICITGSGECWHCAWLYAGRTFEGPTVAGLRGGWEA